MGGIVFKLRFPESRIGYWAGEYNYGGPEQRERETLLENIIGPAARARGYFKLDELETVCRWKSPRRWRDSLENAPAYVEEITRTSLAPAASEQLRIEVLTLLRGVNWPTASAMLHFASASYSILDFRVFWSLNVHPVPKPYRFDLWQQYTEHCRALAAKNKVSMRILDRALWRYSKENQ